MCIHSYESYQPARDLCSQQLFPFSNLLLLSLSIPRTFSHSDVAREGAYDQTTTCLQHTCSYILTCLHTNLSTEATTPTRPTTYNRPYKQHNPKAYEFTPHTLRTCYCAVRSRLPLLEYCVLRINWLYFEFESFWQTPEERKGAEPSWQIAILGESGPWEWGSNDEGLPVGENLRHTNV